MITNRNLVSCLHYQNVSDSAKMLWLLIDSEEKDPDGFVYLSQTDWAEKYHFSVPKLQKNLKSLNDQHLIVRDYRSDSVCGNRLYVKPLPPETKDDMTFFATFDRIEEKTIGLHREARFKDIYNINHSIRQKFTWADLDPNTDNTEAIAKLDEGQEVVFKATVIRTEKIFYFKNVHDIRPRNEFYDNQYNGAN